MSLDVEKVKNNIVMFFKNWKLDFIHVAISLAAILVGFSTARTWVESNSVWTGWAAIPTVVTYAGIMLLSWWVYDRIILRKVDTEDEISKGNIAYAIYNAAFFIAFALIIWAVEGK